LKNIRSASYFILLYISKDLKDFSYLYLKFFIFIEMSKFSKRSDSVSISRSDHCVCCRDYVAVGISCDGCEGWFHDECCGLTATRLSFYRDDRNSEFKWYCLECSKSTFNRLSHLEDKLSLIDSLSTRLQLLETESRKNESTEKKLEESTRKIVDLENMVNNNEFNYSYNVEQMRHELKKSEESRQNILQFVRTIVDWNSRLVSLVTNLATNNHKAIEILLDIAQKQSNLKTTVLRMESIVKELPDTVSKALGEYAEPRKLTKEIIDEVENRSGRSRNVLILNVNEPVENTSFKRRTADKNIAMNIINSLPISTVPKVSRIHRIGKWSASGTQCRPILVEVESMLQRDEIIRHAHNLTCEKTPIRIIGDYKKPRRQGSSNGNLHDNVKNSLMPSQGQIKSQFTKLSKNGVRPRVI
jgi:hypothetical protein